MLKEDVAVLGSPSLILYVSVVSVDVKPHSTGMSWPIPLIYHTTVLPSVNTTA